MLAWLRVDLSAHRPDALLDAYCGCGVFAVCLADLASRAVAGIETDAEAVRCAEVNARCAGVAASFQAGDVASLLDGALESLGPLEGTLVILDPPRRGCAEPVIAALRRRAPGRVIYLSCHPATLARDLSRLIIGGAYSVARLALFDMFPQTAHFEAAVALDRAGVGLAAERA
jgi:23S rRNA (uracil1939-C5)-methyltransferase